MSTQPSQASSISLSSAKVTLVSTGSGITASASSTESASEANPRRKVGSNFERAFEQPGPSTSGTSSVTRPVLKAGKAVSSAPPAGPSRPMTALEEAFANRTVQDQRWLLSFPLAMKQLYFNFAESSNHDQILTGLINRFPELLAGGEKTQPAILVAIENRNWLPAMRFVSACAAGTQIKLLKHECGKERLTYPMLAMARLGSTEPAAADEAQVELASQLICSLFKACPDLLTSTDTAGRNPMHYCAIHCGREAVFRPLLDALHSLCSQQTLQELARHLGSALVAKDTNGNRADEVFSPDNASCRDALRALRNTFPDIPIENRTSSGVSAIDNLSSSLAERGKSNEFVLKVAQHIKDHRMMLAPNMEDPVRSVLDWFKLSNKIELKQALIEVGAPDLCSEVDRLG